MRKDGAGAVYLAELALERGEAEAHLGGLLVGEALDRALVDGARGGEAKVGSRLGDVEREHLHPVRGLDGGRRAVVDAHRALCEAMLLLELPVEQEERLGELGRAVLERLLKEVACALELVSSLSMGYWSVLRPNQADGGRHT